MLNLPVTPIKKNPSWPDLDPFVVFWAKSIEIQTSVHERTPTFLFSPQVTEPWPESVDKRFLQKRAPVCPRNSGEVYLKPGVKSCVMWRLFNLSQWQMELRQGLYVSSHLEMPRNLSGEAGRVSASACLTCCYHVLTLDRRKRGR